MSAKCAGPPLPRVRCLKTRPCLLSRQHTQQAPRPTISQSVHAMPCHAIYSTIQHRYHLYKNRHETASQGQRSLHRLTGGLVKNLICCHPTPPGSRRGVRFSLFPTAALPPTFESRSSGTTCIHPGGVGRWTGCDLHPHACTFPLPSPLSQEQIQATLRQRLQEKPPPPLFFPPSLADIRKGCLGGGHVHFTVFIIALQCLFLIHVPAEGILCIPSASETSRTIRHALDSYAWSAVTMKSAIQSNTGMVAKKGCFARFDFGILGYLHDDSVFLQLGIPWSQQERDIRKAWLAECPVVHSWFRSLSTRGK